MSGRLGRERGQRGRGVDGWTPCVVVAASTGGPGALLDIIPALPRSLPASVVVVQHLPPPHTARLARELADRSAVRVKEAEAGDTLAHGVVHVAPGGGHVTVSRRGGIVIHPGPWGRGPRGSRAGRDGCPSANLAMASVARQAGRRTVGVVLTGMGRDGAHGAQAIRRGGGIVIAQDEDTSLIFGMPKAAIETGCVNAVVPLSRLAGTLLACLRDLVGERSGMSHAS